MDSENTNVIGYQVSPPKVYTAEEKKTLLNLYKQLQGQGKQYGLDWSTKTSGNELAKTAENLFKKGVYDITKLKVDNRKLVYEGKVIASGSKGQKLFNIASGDGLTKVTYQTDANGNVVFAPNWRETSDKGKIAAIAGVAASFIPGVGALGGALISGGTTKLAGGSWKDAIKAGIGSYAGGTLGNAVAGAAGLSGATGKLVSNAVSGGLKSELRGGDFLEGAITSGLTSGLNMAVPTLTNSLVDIGFTEDIAKTVVGAGVSGVKNVVRGGDFLEGAVLGSVPKIDIGFKPLNEFIDLSLKNVIRDKL